MSDTFQPGQTPPQRFSEGSDRSTSSSPWLFGCDVLFLALFGLGILAVIVLGVLWFAFRSAPSPTRIRRGPSVAEQQLPDDSFLVVEQVTFGTQHRFEVDIEQPSGRALSGLSSMPNMPSKRRSGCA